MLDLTRILIPFSLGAFLTLLITSINYRRDHYKEIRNIFFEAVREAAKNGVDFWSSKYDEQKYLDLRGSVTYLQHISPLSFKICNKFETERFEAKLAEFIDESLGRDDVAESTYKVDLQRATRIQTVSAVYLADYSSLYILKMGLFSLVKRQFVEVIEKIFLICMKIFEISKSYYLKLKSIVKPYWPYN